MRIDQLRGVFAAMLTPLKSDFSPDLTAVQSFLEFLASRGCHGAVLLGTTGEGPSFSPAQRISIIKAALEMRQEYPELRLLAGTGTPSLDETIALTRAAFDLGIDAVLVLPPYYYRTAGEEGLFSWFRHVLQKAVPGDGFLLGYHIPPVTGVPLSIRLLERLTETFPDSFAGIKDSSGDPEFARQLGERFGDDLVVLTGNDRLFSLALQSGASGCITALANLYSPILRRIWDSYQEGTLDEEAQQKISSQRDLLDRYPTAPATLKALLAARFGFPRWPVCPPLIPTPSHTLEEAFSEFDLS
ncbi:MAG TPA: dihydrodipicolinate synthase family protein [Anaerolineales bacterium]|nr:dihydrodipicolinate synthase family protein [Anaerolineales bacterium]